MSSDPKGGGGPQTLAAWDASLVGFATRRSDVWNLGTGLRVHRTQLLVNWSERSLLGIRSG